MMCVHICCVHMYTCMYMPCMRACVHVVLLEIRTKALCL